MLIRPNRWREFQHYKDRCPPWIKLHSDLLKNRDFVCLPIASKALAPMLWLLAGESKDGQIDATFEELQFRLHISKKDYDDGLKPLIDKGFFIVDSGALADCYQDAIPETEREAETKTETKAKGERASPNGSRLPADWSLPDDWALWAKETRPELNPNDTAQRFADYWHGVAGAKGRKADWLATWRNWVRSEKAPPPQRVQSVSFAQQEREIGWKRWEEMTGKEHPDRLAYEGRQQGQFIDVQATNILEIGK